MMKSITLYMSEKRNTSTKILLCANYISESTSQPMKIRHGHHENNILEVGLWLPCGDKHQCNKVKSKEIIPVAPKRNNNSVECDASHKGRDTLVLSE